MPWLTISGRRERIPPFPHHKVLVHRSRHYFFSKSPLDNLLLGNAVAIRETLSSLKHDCFVPRALLLDPTNACNLRCKGCWAADYGREASLSYEKLDDILTQSEALGIEECMMSGGEPLMRKDDILKLCAKHRRTIFGLYTNGLLVDEALADEMARLGNLNLFLSIEGWRGDTDARRGEGVFDKVIAAMDILRSRHIGFAFSTCYHSGNYQTIASDEFLDFLREKGAWFGWLFQYVPIGKDADLSLACTPEQREHVLKHMADYSRRHGMVLIDFWNNGHLTFGCVGAGSGFVHINANGDVEPCAFCHYSDANIHDMSLVEALRSPFFRKFRNAQPFDANPLAGCPLMNVPDKLAEIVSASGAHSTHAGAPETVAELAAKTKPLDEAWRPVAARISRDMPKHVKRTMKAFTGYLAWKKRRIDRDGPESDDSRNSPQRSWPR